MIVSEVRVSEGGQKCPRVDKSVQGWTKVSKGGQREGLEIVLIPTPDLLLPTSYLLDNVAIKLLTVSAVHFELLR